MRGAISFRGLSLVVALAALGALCLWMPSWLARQYHFVKDLGPFWVYSYLIVVSTGGVLLAGSSGYVLFVLARNSWIKQQAKSRGERSPSALSHQEQQTEYRENLAQVAALQEDPRTAEQLRAELAPLVSKLEQKRAAEKLEIVAFGTISSGKSSLLNALAGEDLFTTDLRGGTTVNRQELPWQGVDRVALVDTPGLAEIDGAAHGAIAASAASDADLVLLVLDGPLRDSEHRLLLTLGQMEKRLLVCLNKLDWYSTTDRADLLGQLQRQLADMVPPENIVAVRSQPTTRLRVRVTSTNEEIEEQVPVPADIAPLADRMLALLSAEGSSLLMANLLMQSRGLVEEARQRAQAALDRRAWEVVDRYTWGAGGAAALSPTPVLDLLAGSAITTKMVVDLAEVYKQPVDLKMAVELLGQLGKNLLSILGVAAAGPAVTAAVASLLKTVPGAGTIAGGVLQGVVQALVTRWIGAVFIAYFRAEMVPPQGGLAGLARRQWQHLTSLAEMQRFLAAAREQLLGRRA
jgi:predicted GTPase/uncharacterized protein (DUF697 family)